MTKSIMLNSSSRRQFLKIGAIATATFLAPNVIFPFSALADSTSDPVETYHLFLPYQISRYGGKRDLILKSGDICSLNIPPRTYEDQVLYFSYKNRTLNVVTHSLYEINYSLRGKILDTIDQAKFALTDVSRKKCKLAYENLQDGYPIKFEDLSLLDYIISTSKLEPEMIERYQMGSDNYKISLIETGLVEALDRLQLKKQQRKNILGTYQYVKSLEPIPNFELLDILNEIIAKEVNIPLDIETFYNQASAISRAATADLIIVDFIKSQIKPIISEVSDSPSYLEVYQKVRNGDQLSEKEMLVLNFLTREIINSSIPKNAQTIYLLTVKDSIGENSLISVQDIQNMYDEYQNLRDKAEQNWHNGYKYGNQVVPFTTKALSTLGVEAGTGVTITSLSGAAATNATLAWLGGGSVAAGGAGMLGGLTVITGGAALIGAAGILSLMAISDMDADDFKNLTVAGLTGTLAGTGAVGLAWLTASSLGVAGSTTGAAAISTTVAALGGISVMTGGASLVAFGAGYIVWSFLNGKKKRDNRLLHYLETSSYALTDDTDNPIAKYIENNLDPSWYDDLNEIYLAPNINLNKLNNALNTFAKQIQIEPNEKIVALIDTSMWNDTKEGIILTDRRVIWKGVWSSTDLVVYESLTSSLAEDISFRLLEGDDTRFANFLLNLKKEKFA